MLGHRQTSTSARGVAASEGETPTAATTPASPASPSYQHQLVGTDFYRRIVGPGTTRSAKTALQKAHHLANPTSQLIMTSAGLSGSPMPMMAHFTPLKDAGGMCGGVMVVLVASDVRNEVTLAAQTSR
jgi:hypothetical protein